MTRPAWWRGKRGEWYVAAQVALFLLVALGPRTWRGWPRWVFPDNGLVSLAGGACLLGGGALVFAGIARLGSKISPLPYPAAEGTLHETGAYRIVRHPIYSGGLFMAVGWALWSHGWLTFAYSALLFLFLDVKARREERWLREKFPAYTGYQRRVRKFIPFLY
jgi:protein-S-isoprenylcysteine O-methyltransferase Ste14